MFKLTLHLPTRALGLLAAAFALSGVASAQGTGTITGVVVDAATGETLPIASVVVSETGFGDAADVDGRFVIENVPARPGPYAVRASYTGYAPSELPALVRDGETVELRFELSSRVIDEVVVTALGLERNQRELGYAVTEIRGEETTVGDNTNVINTLSGKVAGLQVTGQSGAVGGSSRITLRGVSSLSGDNQPLFVVDGIPISNDNISSGTRISGGVDTANRANDINPNDIASVSVLKGGAAAALYGQRARNGVILITTKSGRNRTRADVQVSSSLLGATPLRLPDFQNEFAPGSLGDYNPNNQNGWGPVIAGQTVTGNLLNPTAPTTLTAQPDNVRDFYETGVTATNSLAFTAGNQGTDFRLGVTNINQGGIVPASDLSRTTVNINGGSQLPNGFTARAAFNYVDTDTGNPVRQGSNNPNVLTTVINGLPRTLDTATLSNYRDETGAQITLGPLTNNPYFIVNENTFNSDLQRVYGNATVGFTPVDWLSFTTQVGTDFYTESRRDISTVGTLGVLNGAFNDNTFRNRETDLNAFATANREFGSDAQRFSVRALTGVNVNERRFERVSNGSEGLSVPGLYNYGNADQNTPGNGSSKQRIYGFFGDVTLGYNNYLFLQLTGRNDNSSTLPVDNRSYFYPSASLSFVLTDALSLDPAGLSYAKLRASAAQVGSDEAPYQLDFRFFPVDDVFGQFGTGFSFPYLGEFVGFEATNTVPPSDLRPQLQTTYAVGAELGLLNDRVTLDVELYDIATTDQIISIPTPQSTGFAAFRTNIGEINNRGVEARVTAETIRLGRFSHNFALNFTRNRNEVVSLAPGVEKATIVTGFNTFAIKGEPGLPLGIYGTGFLRDSTSGLPIIDPLTGLRQQDPGEIRFGDIDPNFQIGFNNTFRFGPFSLGFLIDWKDGGSVYSETAQSLRRSGLAQETVANRFGTIVDNGVIVTERDADGNIVSTRPNDVPVRSMQEFWGQFANGSIQEGGIFDASYVKLRELTFGVQVPARYLRSVPFNAASVSFQGRNLALLYSKVPHIDPETNIFGAVSSGSGYEFNNLPTTRTFGVNIDFTF